MTRALRTTLVLLLILALGCGGDDGGGAADAAADGAADAVVADVREDAAAPAPLRVDLVPYARLRADGTRPAAPLLWPREASDAIATVRDGHADTGWKPVAIAPATVRIDLLPFAGRPLALGPLAMTFDGATPADVSVALAPVCGVEPTAQLDWDDPTAPLALAGRAAGCVTITLTGGPDLVVRTLSLENADAGVNDRLAPAGPAPAAAVDRASGVIEGFYGVPWSWSERHAMVRHMARLGLGAYLYAPKNDPLHRDRWREPYDAAFRDAFADLAAEADTVGVALLFGVSPFIDYDDPPGTVEGPDYVTLREKLLRFLDGGAHGVALLADDIEFELEIPVDADLAAHHVAIANRLIADLDDGRPELEFWFVPTVYSDDRADGWPGGQAYLEGLAALDPRIRILWTGRDTFAPTMEAADMDRFRQATGRDPLIWDNFWANDGGDGFFGRIVLTAFRGRTPDLPGAVAGIAHNLSIQGAISRWTLTTFAAWRDDPAGYTPDAAREQAGAAAVAFTRGAAADADRDAALVRRLMAVFDAWGADVPADAAHEATVGALRDALAAGPDALALSDVRDALLDCAELATLATAVSASGLPPDVDDDLVYPLAKVRDEGLVCVHAIALLGERMAGAAGDAEDDAAEAARKRAAGSRFAWGTGAAGRLLTDVRALEPADLGFWRIPPSPGDPPPCRVGDPFVWAPFDGAEELIVVGISDTAVAAEEIRWTPPRAGRYDAIALGFRSTGAFGWAARPFSLACRP